MTSSTSTLLPNVAMAIFLFPPLMGIFSLINPDAVLAKAFQYPPPDNAARKAHDIAVNLTRLFGVRNLFMGGAALGAWVKGDRGLLGYFCLLAAGVASVDAVVQGGGLKHWWLVPVLVGVGAGLME